MGSAHQCLHSCLGARSVADLEHVDANVQLALKAVQQAKLAWTLQVCQQQLRQEEQQQSVQLKLLVQSCNSIPSTGSEKHQSTGLRKQCRDMCTVT